MTRKKVRLAFITNDSNRKATFKKRKKGLMKKVSELSTLCDVDACAIVYSPYETHPEIWPSPLGVQRVIAQFKNMPQMEQSKKMVNQESFLRQRIAKAKEQLKKQRKDNREKEMTRVMFQSLTGKPLQGLSMIDLNDLSWIIDQHISEIANKLKNRKEAEAAQRNQQLQIAPAVKPNPPTAVQPAAADHAMPRAGENMNLNMTNMNMTSMSMNNMNMANMSMTNMNMNNLNMNNLNMNNLNMNPMNPMNPMNTMNNMSNMSNMSFQAAIDRHAFEMNMDPGQRPPWFMDNPGFNGASSSSGAGAGGDEMFLPFGDQNQFSNWPSNNPFFP